MEEVRVELKDVVKEAYELGLFNITSADTYGKVNLSVFMFI